jgi:hypothetical protein
MSPSRRPPARTASVATALQRTVAALAVADADAGAIQLARRYADAIDAEKTAPVLCEECRHPLPVATTTALERLGPKLLAVLIELGATPGARKAVRGNDIGERSAATSAMDAIRNARDQGLDPAAAVLAALEGAHAGNQ